MLLILKSENLKDTLEKVLNSYKYEKISAKNKFEVFDAAIEMLKDILRAYGFDLKTETIKNDPDPKTVSSWNRCYSRRNY
ncbi:hypothetical protein HYD88_02695 [Mycoplasmopsis bovis]|nr:hypothetical protein HYD88_02695 [Mycoplasmopsis bovis]